jgi:hypothetical protein
MIVLWFHLISLGFAFIWSGRFSSAVRFQIIPNAVQLVKDCAGTGYHFILISDYRKIPVVRTIKHKKNPWQINEEMKYSSRNGYIFTTISNALFSLSLSRKDTHFKCE